MGNRVEAKVQGSQAYLMLVVSMCDAMAATQTVTSDTRFFMQQRMQIDTPKVWLG